MKKYILLLTCVIALSFNQQVMAQEPAYKSHTIRMNLPVFLFGEINGQYEYRLNNRFGLNMFGGIKDFDFFLSEFSFNNRIESLTNYYTGVELRVHGIKLFEVDLFLAPFVKYAHNAGNSATFGSWEGSPSVTSFTDNYLYMGMAAGFKYDITDQMVVELFGGIGRGIYGVVRNQDGLQLFPNQGRFDLRMGLLLGYKF
jgi:hypothetical protein